MHILSMAWKYAYTVMHTSIASRIVQKFYMVRFKPFNNSAKRAVPTAKLWHNKAVPQLLGTKGDILWLCVCI